MIQTKEILKSYFETGDYPTEQQFIDLIDSLTNSEDVLTLFSQYSNVSFTYNELKDLADQNKLVAGRRYILTDYQTKYYIAGTNTAPIEKEVTIGQKASSYAFFNPPLPLNIGDAIEIIALPIGYSGSIQVGDTTTVTNIFGNGDYLQFANGIHDVIDSKFRYSIPRFRLNNAVNGITLNDANGKVVLKPQGVINTDVHDGTPYIEMSATENPTVPFEQIALIAISENTFSSESQSLTHVGDVLEYDFNNNEIKNEDKIVIGNRNGFILRRSNKTLNVDIDNDWRVRRYRRWKVDDINDWNNYILNNSTDQSLYNVANRNECTLANINITENHKYILYQLEHEKFYQDYTNAGSESNVFLTGQGTDIVENIDTRYTLGKGLEFRKNLVATNPIIAKDLFIIPLDQESNPKKIVKRVIINKLFNTIFLDYNSQFGNSIDIDVTINDGISYSTFLTGAIIHSNSTTDLDFSLWSITAIDYVQIRNQGSLAYCHFLATMFMRNAGSVTMFTQGGAPSNVTNWGITFFQIDIDDLCRLSDIIVGGKRTYLRFDNTVMKKCLFIFERAEYINFSSCFGYLTAMKTVTRIDATTFRIDLGTPKNAKKDLYGFYFDTFVKMEGIQVFNNNLGDLLYEIIDGNNNNAKEILTLSLSQ